MDQDLFFRQAMGRTKILRPPRHLLATFGTTILKYVMLSEVPGADGQCRLREGRVTAERPQILTPDLFQKRFEGFGEQADFYRELMDQFYGERFRALEYTFKNELEKTSLDARPLPDIVQRALEVMSQENAPRTALLQGPDATWSLSIMKFIVDVSLRSFSANVQELDERGLFEPEKRLENRQRQQIEGLFRDAQRDPQAIKKLGDVLKGSGLFSDYEDRFFALVRNTNVS